MSLQAAAQHLASRGRGPDTTLVHMAPQEVAGLQALAKAHGGTLTVNPDTGLPEAGFLRSILPMVAGAFLGPAGLGLTAMQAGLAAGALGTMATGSLRKGLMAGLGAYGGAGLGAGLAGAGAAGAAEAAMAGAAPSAAGAAAAPVGGAIGQAAAAAPATILPSVPAAPVIEPYALNAGAFGGAPTFTAGAGLPIGGQGMPLSAANLPTAAPSVGFDPQFAAPVTAAPKPMEFPDVMPRVNAVADFHNRGFMDKMGAGIKALGTESGRSAFMSGAGGPSGLLRAGLSAAAPSMEEKPQTPFSGTGATYEYTYDPATSQYVRVPVGTRAGLSALPSLYAAGGPVEEMSNRNAALTLMADGGQMFAAGGVSHLGDYSDGGRLLKGPGDGVSDSIPATIADKRPARLADGEFVVPARIVSELGNGSTEAGARKLYAMMDRIQKARGKTVGKNRVAVNSRAEKLLPA